MLRARGLVDATSPSRSCFNQRWSRHTPVHEASMRTRPSETGPMACPSTSSDPPARSAPNPSE